MSEFLSWKDANDILFIIKVELPKTSWIHIVGARNKETGEEYLRLRKFRQNFNLKTPEQYSEIVDGLAEGAKNLGWEMAEVGHRSIFKEIEELERLKRLNRIQKGRIRRLTASISGLVEKRLAIEIPQFRKDLQDLKRRLRRTLSERDWQEWLAASNHRWLLGPEYSDTQPVTMKELGWADTRFDFFLQRYDTFYDIVELKSPDSPLFVGEQDAQRSPSRKSPMSAALKDAISQTIEYLEVSQISSSVYLRLKNILVHKPKGMIAMGRTRTRREKEGLKTVNAYLHAIEILSYDDILERGEQLVKKIELRRAAQPANESGPRTGSP